MGNNTNNDAGQHVAKPHNYRTFSVGSGKISGGGYKAKVRLTSTPAGKQTTDVVKQKVGSP